jgi:hypothetical protein
LTKLVLEIEEDYDFYLIGIVAHVKDYRLSWELNRNLNLGLFKDQDLEIKMKENSKSFSFHLYVDEDNSIEYYLIGNRSESGYLIPEESKCDYLFILKGNITDETVEDIIKQLNSFKLILACYSLDVENLKSKKNLIF